MFDITELPRELSQNFYNYIADQFYTITQFLGITSDDEPFDVPLLFNAYGGYSWSYAQGQPSAPSAGAYGYRNTALCNINITSNSIDISSIYYRPVSNSINQSDTETVINWYNNYGNITSGIELTVSEISIYSFQTASNVQTFRPGHNNNYNVLSYTTPFLIFNPTKRTSLFVQSAGTVENMALPDFIANKQPYFTVGYFSDVQHVSTFDSHVFDKNNYSSHTVTLANGDTVTTYSNNSGLILPISGKSMTWKDLENVFTVSTPSNIPVSFPSFEAMKDLPFAYIEPIHQLNYDLQMPDTSEYLDVSVISEPLSVVSNVFDYMWSNITSLGFAPVLGFCLIATLIIRGLRGD